MSPATIKDLARELKLSPSTLSRALRDHPDISPKTKKRVVSLAEERDYHPDSIAQSLQTEKTKTIGVVLGQLILVLPFSIWMLKGYFDNIPVDIDHSARLDDCNIFQRLFYIILPLGAPGIMVAGFFSFVVSWGDYLIVSIISQSQRTATATLVIQRLSSALLIRWGQVAAATVLTIIGDARLKQPLVLRHELAGIIDAGDE